MQNDIYNLMSQEGWYQTSLVEETKINEAKQKFQTLVEEEN